MAAEAVQSWSTRVGLSSQHSLHQYELKSDQTKGWSHNLINPIRAISDQEMRLVHTDMFIKSFKESQIFIAKAAELAFLAVTPMSVIKAHLTDRIRLQAAGSVLAGFLALKYGWAIHLGGGFHHCSSSSAGGFCLIADITLLIKYLWTHVDPKLKVLILDLDAHQGNGHEMDAIEIRNKEPDKKDQLYIMDVYNPSIYPHEPPAFAGIDLPIRIPSRTGDDEYLSALKKEFPKALDQFGPKLVVYNAGTDIMLGDPLGVLSVTAKGIVARDEYVFTETKKRDISLVMLTSGGYQKSNSRVIADSIINLFEKGVIELPPSSEKP